MANNYTFLDASGTSVLAATSIIGVAHQPLVQVSSILSPIPTTPTGNQSVSGTVNIAGNPSISGTVNIAGNTSVSGTVDIGVASGSVVAHQGTDPWVITGSIQGTVTAAGNQSVSGTVDASIIGTVPVTQSGTVISSISGTVALDPSVFGASIMGTVPVVQSGTVITSISGTVALSPSIFGASIIGTVPVTGSFGVETASVVQQGTWRVSIAGIPQASIHGAVSVAGGSVTVENTNVNVSGSVAAFQAGTVITSVAGVPTINIASISTINGGLHINSPLDARLMGTADLRVVQGASVAVIAAQGAGVRAYIDHVQVANYGSASVLVTLADNTTSILGYTIAPAGGGANFDTLFRPAANSPVTASLNGTASVLVSMQGFKGA